VVENKIIFLDRDGTINKLRNNYVKNISEFELLPNVGKHLSNLISYGFKIIIITNQSAINRGLMNIDTLQEIHNYLISELKKDNVIVEKIFYCPHTPNENCECRKPKTKLLIKAIDEFNPVDLNHSWMIGDDKKDIEAGLKVGLNTFRIKTNEGLSNAVNYILNNL